MRDCVIALAVMLALFGLLSSTVAATAREILTDKTYQIREDRFVTTPTPAPLPETWTRYDVPLDDELQRYTAEVCREYNVPTALVLAVMDAESDFQEDAVSEDGCDYGLMQIRATEHTDRCIQLNTYNLLDARQNILTGVDYIAELIGWGYGIEYALSWYHGDGGGPSDYARGVLAEAERIEESAMLITAEGR